MKCMRCGTKIAPGSVFCEDCLADMEKHPVKPGTPVNLPRREKQPVVKRSKKRMLKADEQINILRRAVNWLIVLVIVLTLALTATIYMIVSDVHQSNSDSQSGQNYGTYTSVP